MAFGFSVCPEMLFDGSLKAEGVCTVWLYRLAQGSVVFSEDFGP